MSFLTIRVNFLGLKANRPDTSDGLTIQIIAVLDELSDAIVTSLSFWRPILLIVRAGEDFKMPTKKAKGVAELTSQKECLCLSKLK